MKPDTDPMPSLYAAIPKYMVHALLYRGHGSVLVNFIHVLQGYLTATGTIDMLHKSYIAPICYPPMHHFVTEMCTHVHISVKNGALWDICPMHYGICEMGLLYDCLHAK